MVSDEVIVQIADRLAIPASEIYHIFVEAQSTLALIYTLGVIIILGLPIVLYIGARRWIDDGSYDPETMIGCLIFGVCIGLIIYSVLYYILAALFIPEYVAIGHLISILT